MLSVMRIPPSCLRGLHSGCFQSSSDEYPARPSPRSAVLFVVCFSEDIGEIWSGLATGSAAPASRVLVMELSFCLGFLLDVCSSSVFFESAPDDSLRSLTPGRPMFFCLLRFLAIFQLSCWTEGSCGCVCEASLSVFCCCSRKSVSCSLVSLRTACSLARVDSFNDSRKSISSSSSALNWFFNRVDCHKIRPVLECCEYDPYLFKCILLGGCIRDPRVSHLHFVFSPTHQSLTLVCLKCLIKTFTLFLSSLSSFFYLFGFYGLLRLEPFLASLSGRVHSSSGHEAGHVAKSL